MSYNKQLRCDYLTTNHEGAAAWRMTPEWELYTTVVMTMGVDDKFYEGGDDRVRRIADLVRKVKPEFVAQLAVYTREVMCLRSVPLLLLVELDQCLQNDLLVSQAVSRVVQRADEITELLMCYQWRSGRADLKGLSSQLRMGLAEAFNKFDEYQFAKYDRKTREVTLRDALLLVKPTPKDDAQALIFWKIQNGKLETPYTWETELSAVGQRHFDSQEEKDEAKREVWRQLVRSRRMGYMATLRNLRNMLLTGVDEETIKMACDFISCPDAVRRSKQLPFRFFSAYLELTDKEEERQDYYWEFYQVKAQLRKLTHRIHLVKESVNLMRRGYFLTNVRVVRRTPDTSYAMSICNRTHVPTELGFRPPKRHHRVKVKRYKYKKEPSERNLRYLATQESLLRDLIRQKNLLIKEHDWVREYLLFEEGRSGSMCSSVSTNSKVMLFHIGLLLSMMMKRRCRQAVTGMFGDIWRVYDISSGNILRATQNMMKHEGEVGYSTNGYMVIDWLIQKRCVMDKVMLFTDCQLWDNRYGDANLQKSWDEYKLIAPDAKLYIFDLAGYGQSPVSMKRDDVFCIAGWSDKTLDILAALERGENAIDEIRRIVV